MMNQEKAISPSKSVAVAIASICPTALFCGFKVTPKPGKPGEFAKLPVGKKRTGVSGEDSEADLYTAAEMLAMADPADYWGVAMHRPTFDPFGDLVLTVLDLDTKRSAAPRDIRMTKLLNLAKERGLLTERSHSRKGGHIIFLSKPDSSIPKKIDLGNHQEIEVFGYKGSAGKSVMLTGDNITGNVIELEVSLRDFMHEAGITDAIINPPKPTPPPPAPTFPTLPAFQKPDIQRVIDALNHINPDEEYTQWIEIGMALQTEFGHQGFDIWDAWSSKGEKYPGQATLGQHWKSFKPGQGVTMGTLFHLAKSNGWESPTPKQERLTAIQDFADNIKRPENEVPPQNDTPLDWPELQLSFSTIQAPRYLIDGFIAHGFWMVAGQPGVGKTTSLLPVLLAMCGIDIDGSELMAKHHRKVIMVTEDAEQVQRGLAAYVKYFGIDSKAIEERFILIRARRSELPKLLKLHQNIERHTINGERPVLVLDTANATLALDNENDNSEVGEFINGLKQTIYEQMNTSILIITHLNKQVSRQDSDAMARGASAFTGDVTGTAIVFQEEEKRFMRLIKRRYEPEYDEIVFNTIVVNMPAIDQDGVMVDIVGRVMVPEVSSQADRQAAKEGKKEEQKNVRIVNVTDSAIDFVQSVINGNPNGVIMKHGKGGNPAPPSELANCFVLNWDHIYESVSGSKSKDAQPVVKAEIKKRFMTGAADGAWVRLEVVQP